MPPSILSVLSPETSLLLSLTIIFVTGVSFTPNLPQLCSCIHVLCLCMQNTYKLGSHSLWDFPLVFFPRLSGIRSLLVSRTYMSRALLCCMVDPDCLVLNSVFTFIVCAVFHKIALSFSSVSFEKWK